VIGSYVMTEPLSSITGLLINRLHKRKLKK